MRQVRVIAAVAGVLLVAQLAALWLLLPRADDAAVLPMATPATSLRRTGAWAALTWADADDDDDDNDAHELIAWWFARHAQPDARATGCNEDDACAVRGAWRDGRGVWRVARGAAVASIGVADDVARTRCRAWTVLDGAPVVLLRSDDDSGGNGDAWSIGVMALLHVVAAQRRLDAPVVNVLCDDCARAAPRVLHRLQTLLRRAVPRTAIFAPDASGACVAVDVAVVGTPRGLVEARSREHAPNFARHQRALAALRTLLERLRGLLLPPRGGGVDGSGSGVVAHLVDQPDVDDDVLRAVAAAMNPRDAPHVLTALDLMDDRDVVRRIETLNTADLLVLRRDERLLALVPWLRPGCVVVELIAADERLALPFQTVLGALGVRHLALVLPHAPGLPPHAIDRTWLTAALRSPAAHDTAALVAARFLLFQPWEQLNNQLVAFRSACAVAIFTNRTLVLPYLGFRRDAAQRWNFDFAIEAFEWRPMERYFDNAALLDLPCRTVSYALFRAATGNRGAERLLFNPLLNHTTAGQMQAYYEGVLQLPFRSISATQRLDQLSEGKIRAYYGSLAAEQVLPIGVAFWLHDFGRKLHYPYREYHDVMGNALYAAINRGMRPRPDLARAAQQIAERVRPFVALHARVGQDYELKCTTVKDDVARARCLPAPGAMVARTLAAISNATAGDWSVYVMSDQPTLELPFPAAPDPVAPRRVFSRVDVVGAFDALDPIETSLQEQAISTAADVFIGNIFSSFSRTVFEQRQLAGRPSLSW